MAFTAANAITEVRYQISDEVATYRWSDPKLLAYLNEAWKAILIKHPEAACISDDVVITSGFLDLTSTSATVPLRDEWRIALVHWMSWHALMEDADDENNMRLAKEHQGFFKEAIG